jgi:hypothetical protein
MDQQATIEHLRWWNQVYFWLAIGLPILGAIAGGLLHWKRQHIEGELRELSAQLTRAELHTLYMQNQGIQEELSKTKGELADARQNMQRWALTTDQRERVLARLKSGPKGEMVIVSLMDNVESFWFAGELKELLEAGGWTVHKIDPHRYMGWPIGLVLHVHSLEGAPVYAGFLQDTQVD